MSDLLRFISSYIYFLNKALFKELIKTDLLAIHDDLYFKSFDSQNEDSQNGLTILINKKFDEIVLSARNLDWGNEYHIL